MTGGVMLWPFDLADLPAGWALCNGTRGTPDLRGKAVGSVEGKGFSGDAPLGDDATAGLVRPPKPEIHRVNPHFSS